MPCKSIVAIILASGKGTRFGMPKAEAGLDGISFLARIKASLSNAGIGRIVVADSYNSPDMLATLRLAVADIMLQEGELGAANAYLIHPVDFPFVLPATIVELIQAHQNSPNSVIHPTHNGRRGHPIIIPAGLNLLADDEGKGLREVIAKNNLSHLNVPVFDTGVISNINTPEDLQKWMQKN
jgi:CTP:molybdopterin cytidylyltransferase MocA